MGLVLRGLGLMPGLLHLPLHDVSGGDLLFVAAALVGGWNFFPKGIRSARLLALDMNFLMTVAILGAVVTGETFEAATIAFLFSLAELLEGFSVDRARRSVEALFDLTPDTAVVLVDGAEVRRYVEEVRPGDHVVIRPGRADPGRRAGGGGRLGRGPVARHGRVDAGGEERRRRGVRGHGQRGRRAARPGGARRPARPRWRVWSSSWRRPRAESTRTERFVERFARGYTPAVTLLALLVAVGPPLLAGRPLRDLVRARAHAAGHRLPVRPRHLHAVAVVSGVTAAARNGVLIKGGVHLEAMGEVGAVAFDKTGTLTRGPPRGGGGRGRAGSGLEEAGCSGWPAAPGAALRAPVGPRRVDAAERGAARPRRRVEDFEALPGRGVRATVEGRTLWSAAPSSSRTPPALEGDAVACVGRARPWSPSVRPRVPWGSCWRTGPGRERPKRWRSCAARGEHVVMLTGDNAETAGAVAEGSGVDDVRAELLPEDKVALV